MKDVIDHRDTRREYIAGELRRRDLDADPVRQFSRWLDEAHANDAVDATALSLATATKDGRPSVRIVLLKHFDREGFCWYTDKRSPAGQQITENPWAEMMFFWSGLDRQVRIHGRVKDLPDEDAEAYYRKRPFGSRISALASQQSAVIPDRDYLEKTARDLETRYADGEVPRNTAWGGYRLIPEVIEFWQGRPNRLHDRFRYRREGDEWIIERLSP